MIVGLFNYTICLYSISHIERVLSNYSVVSRKCFNLCSCSIQPRFPHPTWTSRWPRAAHRRQGILHFDPITATIDTLCLPYQWDLCKRVFSIWLAFSRVLLCGDGGSLKLLALGSVIADLLENFKFNWWTIDILNTIGAVHTKSFPETPRFGYGESLLSGGDDAYNGIESRVCKVRAVASPCWRVQNFKLTGGDATWVAVWIPVYGIKYIHWIRW